MSYTLIDIREDIASLRNEVRELHTLLTPSHSTRRDWILKQLRPIVGLDSAGKSEFADSWHAILIFCEHQS
jgi:hypothetical protein